MKRVSGASGVVVVLSWLLLSACGSSSHKHDGDSAGGVLEASQLAGDWAETWAPGQETDVTYHDHYVVTLAADGTLTVTCVGRASYQYPRVEIADGKFYVRVINDSGDGDPYIIDYALAMNKQGALVGRAVTNHGSDVPIVWKRAE